MRNLNDYELMFKNLEFHEIPFKKILLSSYKKALWHSRSDFTYYFLFHFYSEHSCLISLDSYKPYFEYGEIHYCELLYPRAEITLHYKHLFGLITGTYQWHNAVNSSTFCLRSFPQPFKAEAQEFLHHFHI